jgi:hypothetical protein
MAGAAAEAAALDAAMGRVNRTFDDNQKKTTASAEAIIRARGEVDQLRREYQRYQQDYERGQERVNEATQRARDVLRDQRDDLNAVREAHNALSRAEGDAERLRNIAVESYERYHAKLAAVRMEVERFNLAHVEASRGFRNMTRDAEKMGEALESVSEKLSSFARIMGSAGLFGLFGGAAGGSLFATGAGGLHLLSGAMALAVEAAQTFVGAIALIPAAVQGAGLALGTLAIAFHGVGEALSSIGDPAKFIQSIRQMSPAMQQVMLTVESFANAMRGVRQVIQKSFASQFVQDIQPLITTWLPQLMHAGQAIATEWGQAFHQVFQFFQTSAAQQGFQTFVNNLVVGFRAARGAIEPLLSAWNTLATVGSSVFPRLGEAITVVANEFNRWIEASARNGSLLAFINKAIDNFTNMGRIVRDVAIGINNVFGIFQTQNGSVLQNMAQMSAHFRSWSASLSGQSQIGGFFTLLKTAFQAIQPQLVLLGQGLAIVGRTLTVLGIAIQPGIHSFFVSFKEALTGLAPYIIQLAPAINQFLSAFGRTLLETVNTLGPRLPTFFQSMSDAFVNLMQLLPPVVEFLGKLLDHATPGKVEGVIALAGAFKLLSSTLPLVKTAIEAVNIAMKLGPIGGLITAVGLLVGAGVYLYENWDKVKDKANELTSRFGGLTGILDRIKRAWDSVTSSVTRFWSELTSGISGGLSVVMRSIGNLGDTIRNYFSGLWDEAIDWGARLITNFANGITNAVGTTLQPAIDAVASLIPDSWKTNSPAKRGPLSEMSPEEMGTRLVTQYAGGMISGRSSVTDAASSVAGAASGIGGGGGGAGGGFGSFSSAGIGGQSGKDFSQGHSGFDQWVSFLTKDLTAWNNIFREAFGLVSSISDIVTNTVRVAANLWNGGDNPITRAGGLMGPPAVNQQQTLFGVPNVPVPGVAPDDYGRKLAAGQAPAQQSIPGVPNVGPSGRPTGGVPAPPASPPTPPGPTSAATSGQAGTGQFAVPFPGAPAAPGTPASTTGAATGAVSVPLIQNPDGTWTSTDPAWAHLIQRESSGINQRQSPNTVDVNTGGNEAEGLFQITPDTWRRHGGTEFAPNPLAATPQQQAQIAARIIQRNPSGSDWGAGLPGRENAQALVSGLTQPATSTGAAGAAPPPPGGPINARNLPEGMGNPEGLHPNTELANRAVTAVFGDRIKAAGGSIGGNRTGDSGSGEHHGGALDIVLGPLGEKATPERVALGNEIQAFLQQNSEAFGTQWTIWQDQITSAGGEPRAYKGLGDQGVTDLHYDHIHSFFGDSEGNVPSGNTPDAQGTGLFNLPQGYSGPLAPGAAPTGPPLGDFDPTGRPRPAGITPGGLHIPSDGATLAVGALGGLGGLAILSSMGSRARLKWLQFNYDRLDAKVKAEVINSLSPEERALAGKNPEVAFGPEGAQSPSVRGLIVDLGGTPPVPGEAIPGVPPEVSANWTPEQRSWMSEINRRPNVPGAELGNLTEGEMRYASRLMTGLDPGAIPPTPDKLLTPEGWKPYAEAMPAAAPAPATGTPPATRPITTAGEVPPSVVGDAGRAGIGRGLLRGLGGATDVLGIATAPLAAGDLGPGFAAATGATILGAAGLGLSAAAGAGLTAGGLVAVPATVAGTLYATSTMTGSLSGQESTVTPGVIYGPNGQVISAGPRAPSAAQPTTSGQTPGVHFVPGTGYVNASGQSVDIYGRPSSPSGLPESVLRGADLRNAPPGSAAATQPGLGGFAGAQAERRGSTPVHLTNPNELPGGTHAPQVRPTSTERPIGTPQPGQPGFVGPVAPGQQQQPQQGGLPGAQAQRRGTVVGLGASVANRAPIEGGDPTGAAARQFSTDTRTPMDKFTQTMSSVGSIAGDAFTVFQDYIESIGAAANITKTLVRGFANTEDVVGFIQQFQTFIKTAADIAKLVGDVGGAIGGAGAGDPSGMTGAIGGAISAISGIVESALTATNAAISLGIDIYHEVGKYAGFIIGEFLGGAGTGPLGGNVRMLLNTRTNQLQTYGEDNPLNKNTFDVPVWQRSYTQQQTPPSLPPQVNIYTGPNQTPAGMMQESMWAISTGSAPVASVAGHD